MRSRTCARAILVVGIAVGALLAGLPMTATAVAAPSQQAQLSAVADASVADSQLGWGESTTVRGSGFAANAPVRIILYAGGNVLANLRADAGGGFSTSVTIPGGLASSTAYKLTVQGPAADGLFGYIELPLTIVGPSPVLSIDSDDLRWDEVTTVRGDRYKPGAKITVSLFPDNRLLAEATADGDGQFATEIQVPTKLRSAVDYQIAVTGQGIDSLFHFDVIEVAIIGDRPTIAIDRDRVDRGGTLAVSGELFFKDTVATVTLLPGYERLGQAGVGEDGSFATTVTIPVDAFARDPHLVVVTGTGADGLPAYSTAVLTIDPPERGPGPTAPTLPLADADDPELDRFVDRYLGLPPPPGRSSGGPNLALIVFILMLLILLLLILTSRRRRRR